MKTLMIVFLVGFLVFGAIGLLFRLGHDWSSLTVESGRLSEDSIARRDGRAMQIFRREDPTPEKLAEAERKAERRFRRQLVFSVLSGICLLCALVCGALLTR